MALTGLDSVFASISNDRCFHSIYSKNYSTASAMTGSTDMFLFVGTPPPGLYSGSVGSCTTMSDQTVGAMYTGGSVQPYTKHLLNAEITATGPYSNSTFILVDMLAYYIIDLSLTTSQNLTASGNILPLRNGVQHSGENVQMFFEPMTSAALSLTTITVNYTNNNGVNGQSLGATTKTTNATKYAMSSAIYTPGASNFNFGPFLPHGVGNTGVQSVQSIQLNAGESSGRYGIILLCEPITMLQTSGTFILSNRDFIFSKPSLPRIKDGACLNLIMHMSSQGYQPGVTATFDFVWG